MNRSANAKPNRPRKGGQKKTSMSVDDISSVLRERIVEHELPPGVKLREAPLAEEFGVPRPRIRGAFGKLEALNLIELIPGRGAVVVRMDAEEIFSLYAVREVLEALLVRIATENAASGTWDEFVIRFGAPAEAALANHDFDYYLDNLAQFRAQCIEAANNSVLTTQLDMLYDRTKAVIRRLVLVPGRAAEGLRQHQEILAAMQRGDAETAENLKRQNIRSSCECFRNYRKFVL